MKKNVPAISELWAADFVLVEPSNLEKLEPETPDFVASLAEKHLGSKGMQLALPTLWNSPN